MTGGHLIICGAGIAGLTAGLCALKAGWQVSLIERADMLSEVGAGLQVGANAMKVLAALGLAEAVAAAGHIPEALELRQGASGEAIFSVPAGEAGRRRWGAPHVNIRRAALQGVLLEAFEARAPGRLRLSGEGVDFSETPEGVALILADGTSLSGDALIAADGVRSALRTRFGSGRRPDYTGHTALRVLVEADRGLKERVPDASIAWTGASCHAVTYYLKDRELINFVGVIETPEVVPEGWHNEASLDEARTRFSGFAAPVRAILEAAGSVRRWGLYDRPPPDHLAKGRVAMVGDSAVPMPPFMAQGASFAMECAWAAIWSLATTQRFDAYDAAMRLRGARILDAARRNGGLFHGRGLPALAGYLPVRAAARLAPVLIAGRFDWVYGYDVTQGRPIETA